MNKFDNFLKNREQLIFLYNKGDLTKDEFIEENFNSIKSLDIKPFRKIDNIKKAIYNYQHYNVLAKYYQKKSHSSKKNTHAKNDYIELSKYYYSKKDLTTLNTLKMIDYKNIEAYFVKANSPHLKKKLFEILFKDFDNLIFHSINTNILNNLIYENVFTNEIRVSLVNDYINKIY